VLILAVTAFGIALLALDLAQLNTDARTLYAILFLAALGYGTAGALVARAHPGNPIGWLLLIMGFGFGATSAASLYPIYALVTSPGSLPAVELIGTATEWMIILAVAPVGLVFLLFPTGRALSGPWRPVVTTLYVAIAVDLLIGPLVPGTVNGLSDHWQQAGITIHNPLGVEALEPVLRPIQVVAGLVTAVCCLLGVAALIVRSRRAVGEEREQVRWLTFVAAAMGVLFVTLFFPAVAGSESTTVAVVVSNVFWYGETLLLCVGIPAACAFAITKRRLYDIDLVIKKTVVVGALAATISLVYVVVVVGIGGLAGGTALGGGAGSAIATAIVALAFIPVRNRARRLADRLVYGKRAAPYEVLTGFSEGLSEGYATEDVVPHMARVLGEGVGASSVVVWIRVGEELRASASWPATGAEESRPLSGDRLPDLAPAHAEEVRHQGELLGALSVIMPSNDPMTPVRAQLVRDLASQAGLVLRNVRLVEELRESRRRIVAAGDARARKVERNLHDGAQQQLVALAVKLRLAEQLTARDPAKASEMLQQLQGDASDAVETLRDLARGIYPPLLADQGLVAALSAQARKSAVGVRVDAEGIGRHPEEVEAAVYFCVLEALNNVAKYSRAASVEVRLRQSNGRLSFTVADDGVGFEVTQGSYGTGLQGMVDRVDAIGGRLEVRSSLGSGTTVQGSVPIASAPAEPSSNLADEAAPVADASVIPSSVPAS
jgi:signal transduction histidine kinase